MLKHVKSRGRRGAVLPLAALLLVFMTGLIAFGVDLGYIALVRTEMQRAADAAALAGAAQLLDTDQLKGTPAPFFEILAARSQTISFAGMHTAGGKSLTMPFPATFADIIVGYKSGPAAALDPMSSAPNAVHVLVRRDARANGPLRLSFGSVLNTGEQSMAVGATAYFETGIKGFRLPEAQAKVAMLPFTLHVDDWNDAFTSGDDEFTRNDNSLAVTSGPDGIREVKLFPLDGTSKKKGNGVTPGNFGTVDLGAANNSTADPARQIVQGLNASDLSHFPNSTIQLGNDGTLVLEGDTGVSAGMKDELESIIGQPRIIPLYSSVSGNGNNSRFVIVKFVGVTVLEVQLTGSLSSKHVTVQPAFVMEPSALAGGSASTSQFIRRPLALVN